MTRRTNKLDKIPNTRRTVPTKPGQMWCHPEQAVSLTVCPDATKGDCRLTINPTVPPLATFFSLCNPRSDSKTVKRPTDCCPFQLAVFLTHSHTLIGRKCTQRNRSQLRWLLRAVGWHWRGSQPPLHLIPTSSRSARMWLDGLVCY